MCHYVKSTGDIRAVCPTREFIRAIRVSAGISSRDLVRPYFTRGRNIPAAPESHLRFFGAIGPSFMRDPRSAFGRASAAP